MAIYRHIFSTPLTPGAAVLAMTRSTRWSPFRSPATMATDNLLEHGHLLAAGNSAYQIAPDWLMQPFVVAAKLHVP
jgi:hypothetical protein